MSVQLPTIDLTGAIIGQKFKIDFTTFVKFDPSQYPPGGYAQISAPGTGQSKNAHIEIFNESACGLAAVLKSSGDSFYIPAGRWGTTNINPNDNTIELTVQYILPNPPVSLITAIYYYPGEEVPPGYTLGNSPIGIGGSVATSSVQTLSNEGTAANLLVIDVGDVAFAQLFTLFTDGHAVWSVDQTGVKHQAIKISTTANALQLGQTGDIVEVLGALLIDQTLHAIGNAQHDGTLLQTGKATFSATPAIVADTINSNASVGVDGVISVSGSGGTQVTRLQSANQIIMQVPAGTGKMTVDGTNVTFAENINATTATFTGTVATARTNFTTGGYANQVVKSGTGNGSAAFGIVPFTVFCDPCTLSGSSQTIGITKASTATVTTGAALAWDATGIN